MGTKTQYARKHTLTNTCHCLILIFPSSTGSLLHEQGRLSRDLHRLSVGGSVRGWLALLLIVAVISSGQTETISRLNYGVIFEGRGSACAIYDFWAHTFQIPFPELKKDHVEVANRDRNITCSVLDPTHIDACLTMQAALESVNDVRTKYMNNLKFLLKLAKRVMPRGQWNDTGRSRSKRSLLPFIGDISHALFGTATEKEVKQMAKHIDVLEKRNERMAKAFAQYTDDLSSFMTVSNRRHNMIRETMQDNRQAISALAHEFAAVTNTMQHSLQFSVLLNKEIYLAMTMQEALQEFLHGIHGLLQHRISPYLLPFNDIKLTRDHINERLAQANSQLSVKDMSPNDFYSSPNFLWTYKNQSLFITVKFPLITAVSHLEVFEILAVPVPFNLSSDHTTQLLNLPRYIAFTRDRHYYTFPSDKIWEQGILNAQEYNLPMHPIDEISCATSIFFDNKRTIMSSCDFRVQVNAMKPTITHINEGRYLMANISNVFLRCPSGLRQQQGCKFCILTVPCLCDISSGSSYFPPRLNHCLHNENKATILHPVNLAVLMYLFHDHQISDIYGDTAYDKLPAIQTPALSLFKHNLSEVIANDKQNDLSLKRIADAIKNDKLVFQTLADPILDQLNLQDDNDEFSWTAIIAVSDSLLTIVLGVALAILGVKVYTMSKVIATLSMVKPAECKSLVFQYTSTTPTTLTPIVIIKERDDTILYIILFFSLLTLAITFFRYMSRLSKQATIGLEITNAKSCVVIPLRLLPFCPKFYHICAEHNFGDFAVNGWFRPIFSWSKRSLTVTNLLDRSVLDIPERVELGLFMAFKLKRILRSDKVYAYVVGVHGMHAFHMRICPIDCQICAVQFQPVESPAQANASEIESDLENA